MTVWIIVAAIAVGIAIGTWRMVKLRRLRKAAGETENPWKKAGLLGTLWGSSILLSLVATIGIWARYSASDVNQWLRYNSVERNDPVFDAVGVFPFVAGCFTVVTLGLLALAKVLRTERRGYRKEQFRTIWSTPLLALASMFQLIRRADEEYWGPLWLYLIPLIATIPAGIFAFVRYRRARRIDAAEKQEKAQLEEQQRLAEQAASMAQQPLAPYAVPDAPGQAQNQPGASTQTYGPPPPHLLPQQGQSSVYGPPPQAAPQQPAPQQPAPQQPAPQQPAPQTYGPPPPQTSGRHADRSPSEGNTPQSDSTAQPDGTTHPDSTQQPDSTTAPRARGPRWLTRLRSRKLPWSLRRPKNR